MATIGYDYILSKRTKMYAAYSKIDNGLKFGYPERRHKLLLHRRPGCKTSASWQRRIGSRHGCDDLRLGLQHIF